MTDTSDRIVEELPWYEILDKVHHRYYQNLEKHFADNPEMLELFRNTQIGVCYVPELAACDSASSEQKATSVWDELAAEVTEDLHHILSEDYQVPAEQVRAIHVGYIAAIFLSPAEPWGSSCPQKHKCSKNVWVMAPCPCTS